MVSATTSHLELLPPRPSSARRLASGAVPDTALPPRAVPRACFASRAAVVEGENRLGAADSGHAVGDNHHRPSIACFAECRLLRPFKGRIERRRRLFEDDKVRLGE